jgi:hypothetical protein
MKRRAVSQDKWASSFPTAAPAAAPTATLPGGADAHTLNEHIEVDSLAERGRLMAGLLATLE